MDWVNELFTKGVKDSRGNYEVEKCIGDVEGAKVYKAAYKANQSHHRIDVALKVTLIRNEDITGNFGRWYKKLDEEARESFLEGNEEDGDEIENIIGINNYFNSNYFFCVSMPLFEEGSLRYILSRRFSNGMPQDCVAIALRETARGLSLLHRNGLCHTNVNAGLIFVSRSPVRIRLAYEATNYYHNPDSSPRMKLINSYPVSEQNRFWSRNRAHPPEIKDRFDKNEYKTSADIWGLGFLALELFYGSLPEVTFQEDSKVMRDYITEIEVLREVKDLIIDMRTRKEEEKEKRKKTVEKALDMLERFFAKPISHSDLSKGEKEVGLHPSSSEIEGVNAEEDKEELGLHPNSPESEEVKAEEGKPKKLWELLNLKGPVIEEVKEEEVKSKKLSEHLKLKGPEIEEVKAEGRKSKKLWELFQEETQEREERETQEREERETQEGEERTRTTKLLKDFVNKCFALAPEDRPAADELLNHPFLENCKDLRYFEDVVLKEKDPSPTIRKLRISS